MRFFSTFLLSLTCLSVLAQNTSSDIIQPRNTQARPAQQPQTAKPAANPSAANRSVVVVPLFPQTWVGKWRGSLNVWTMPNRYQRIPMVIEIKPTADTSRYSLITSFGADTLKGGANYEIVRVNPQRGIYQIDQKNSVKMDAFFIGNRLVCEFVAGGVRFITSYERQGENMIFEVISGRDAYTSTSGGGKAPNAAPDAKPLPVVQSFPMSAWQRAILTRGGGGSAASAKPASTAPKKKL